LGDRENRARIIVCQVATGAIHLIGRTVIHNHDGLNISANRFKPPAPAA
jgi:hypothetical protein